MMRHVAIALLFLIVGTSTSPAAAADNDLPAWLKPFEIRQTFDGGNGEGQPAVISLVAPHDGAKPYGLVDVAVKRTMPDLRFGVVDLVPAPAVEYHQAKSETLLAQDRINKLSPELIATFMFSHVQVPGLPGGHPVIPFLFTKYAVNHDFLTGENGGTASFLAEPYSRIPWIPGGVTDPAFLHYVPSAGFEYFNNPAIKDGDTVLASAFAGWTATVRLYVELDLLNPLFPVKATEQPAFVMLLTTAVRKPLGMESDASHHTVTSIEMNYYFDKNQIVGIGYTHQTGEDPKVNFVRQRRDVLALKVKL
jgi:hypothetical protein